MKKHKSLYEGNKKIMEDEASYPDKNTVALIDLIVDIIVTKTLSEAENPNGEKAETLPQLTTHRIDFF